jgi:type IV pilus assembly protein PilB
MVAGRPRLGSFLMEQEIITEDQLDTAMEHQSNTGGRLGQALIDLGFCTDADIARALADQLEIPFVDLEEDPPSADCIALLPREVALEYGILPIRMQGLRLLVAALDPYDIRLDEALRQATGLNAVLVMAPASQLQELLRRHYAENLLEEPHPSTVDELEEVDGGEQGHLAMDRLVAAGEQVSTIRIVNTLIADAVRRGASDLHIEPEQNRVRVRCRIDGRMCAVASLPTDLLQSAVARVKIMAGMDISENRKPQDGGCGVKVDGRSIELRVATLRGIHGEIVVIRILSQDVGLQHLDSIGFQQDMHRDFRRLLAARHGLLLITGPTGSGKTTTLYAALTHLDREDLNIMTVEDPVESRLPGINQIQVHDRAGRSFATALRSILRQDPDVIMVGEIRDVETVDIACRASLTGHLVLTTLHTQHTMGTVARLLEMGLEPWMVASCLNGVLSQRLVRRVCENCAVEYSPPSGLRRALEAQFGSLAGAQFRKGTGCAACLRSGSKGRIGVYELLTVDDTMRDLLARGSDFDRMREHVFSRGFQTMEADAFRKACQGLISPEEIIDLGFSVAMAMEDEEVEVPEPVALEAAPAEDSLAPAEDSPAPAAAVPTVEVTS